MKQQTLAMAADQERGFEQYRRATRRDIFLSTMDSRAGSSPAPEFKSSRPWRLMPGSASPLVMASATSLYNAARFLRQSKEDMARHHAMKGGRLG